MDPGQTWNKDQVDLGKKIYTTNFTLVVAGSVETFERGRLSLRIKLAAALKVHASMLDFLVSAASVKVAAWVQTTDSKVSSDVHTQLVDLRANPSLLSSALGITVESITAPVSRVITKSGGSSSMGAIIGGVAGASALVVFAAVGIRIYFKKKKKWSSRSKTTLFAPIMSGNATSITV